MTITEECFQHGTCTSGYLHKNLRHFARNKGRARSIARPKWSLDDAERRRYISLRERDFVFVGTWKTRKKVKRNTDRIFSEKENVQEDRRSSKKMRSLRASWRNRRRWNVRAKFIKCVQYARTSVRPKGISAWTKCDTRTCIVTASAFLKYELYFLGNYE